MWYGEKYQPDGKQPYLLAHLEDFAALRKMLTNRRRHRIEIVRTDGCTRDRHQETAVIERCPHPSFEVKRKSSGSSVKRRTAVLLSVRVRTPSGETSLPFRIEGKINIVAIRSASCRRGALAAARD
jgi:hypothetical protein